MLCNKIKEGLHTIENLQGTDNKTIEYCEELLTDMLEHEAYFSALQSGLLKSTGAYEEQKTKNS
jgi:hypothetical protein